jgi:hypothetical protein
MRCYSIRGGHIADVDQLAEFSDVEAIAKAHALFSERKDLFEGFEVGTPFLERTQGKLQERARAIIEGRPEPEGYFDG